MSYKIAEANQEIQAPIHHVWELLVGVEEYAVWNPFIINIRSDRSLPDVGTRMEFTVRFENGRKIKSKEKVTVFSPPKLMENGRLIARWEYDFYGILDRLGLVRATRIHVLTQKDAAAPTHYHTTEKFWGFAKNFIPLKAVQKDFDAQTNAFKRYAENKINHG